MRSRCLMFACLLLLPGVAGAQDASGLYINLGAGANFAGDVSSAQETTKLETNPGPVGLAALGWSFGNGLRGEFEGSYRANSVAGILTRRQNGNLIPLSEPSGTARVYAVTANLVYDFPVQLPAFPARPYAGAGIGYSWVDLGSLSGHGFGTLSLPQGNTYTGPTSVTFGSAGAFAYQAMAGASLPLAAVPGLALTLEYRFFGTARADVPVSRTAANATNLINGAVPFASTHNGFTEQDSSILIGLRYRFGGL